MIARDMPVQIRRCGTMVPVQNLAIGDLVYDPLSDNYIEIIDILSRETSLLAHRLARLPAGRLGQGLPRQDVFVSRSQPVAFTGRAEGRGAARLDFGAAHQIGDEMRLNTVLFAVLPERPGCINVAGAILRLLDPAAIETGPAARGRGLS